MNTDDKTMFEQFPMKSFFMLGIVILTLLFLEPGDGFIYPLLILVGVCLGVFIGLKVWWVVIKFEDSWEF